MWPLLMTFLSIAMTIIATQSQAMASKKTVSSPFANFSPTCALDYLYECEYFGKADSHFITELKTIMRNLKCQPNKSFIDLSENISALMKEISTLPINFNSITFGEYFKNIATSIAEHQDLIINISSTTENLIQNEMKEIRNELKSLKESFEQNKAQEEIKSSIEALVSEVKNISKEILSGKKPRNCAGVSLLYNDRVTKVYPHEGNVSKPIIVLCDQTTDGGGWTVIQNRDALPVREKFERGWDDYVKGFGDIKGEFWLGLDNIHALTNSTPMELRVDLEDYDGVKTWAKYDYFRIGDESTKYVLTLGKYSGDAGDALTYYHNGMKFSTFDQDNDDFASVNCALKYRGGWWYEACLDSNLNGYQHVGQHDSFGDGILWYDFRDDYYSYKKASMKIRPKSFN